MMDSPFLSGDAQWIWALNFDDAAAAGQFVMFRKTFCLDAVPPGSILLHVSADTRYQLYLNGHSVSFGPCKSYLTHWNYETVDIGPHLRVGVNVLAARVLRFSSTHPGCLSMIRSPYAGFILHCRIADTTVHTDTTWVAKKDHATRVIDDTEWDFRLGPPFLCLNERVDGRRLEHGWFDVGFDDESWPRAIISTPRRKMSPMLDPRRLFPRDIPLLTEDQKSFDGVVKSSASNLDISWGKLLQNSSSLTLPTGTYTVDIESKCLTTGFIDLVCEFDGHEDESPLIEILYSECYEQPIKDGQPRLKGNRIDFQKGQLYGPTDYYIPHKGSNHYSPFWWRTFRFVRLNLTVRKHHLTLKSFSYRSTHYPLRISTIVKLPSIFLTQLWDISLNTLQNCMHETYEDCPFYEQNQFAMDSRSQMLFTYLVSRDDRLARKTMQEFYSSRREDGLLETHFPNPGRSVNIPTFSLFWILMVYDHMVTFGDESLIKRYIGTVDGILQYFEERINKLGLVGQFDQDCWPFVDWVDEWFTEGKGFLGMAVPKAYYQKGAATYNSLLYAYALLKSSELAAFLGRHDTGKEYISRQQNLFQAIRTHCFDPSTGLFLDGPGAQGEFSQHVQVFACLSGCVTGDTARSLIEKTVLQRDKYKLAKASFAHGFYLFRAASIAGVYEQCWDTLIEPWRKMMDQNLTTWAESESMTRSDCHGWSATPLYEIGTEILGFRQYSRAYLDRIHGKRGEAEVQISLRQKMLSEASAWFIIGHHEGNDRVHLEWDRAKDLEVINFE